MSITGRARAGRAQGARGLAAHTVLLAVVTGAVFAVGSPAVAQGSITVTPNPVPVATNSFTEVEVRWSGQPARTLIFASVCVKSSKDPDFQVGVHCSPLAQVEVNGTADGSGSAMVPVFRGQEPTTDLPWGCFAPGDAVPPGVLGATSCYLRLTNNLVLNNDDAVEVAIGVTGAGDPVDRGVLGAPVAAAPVAPVAPAGGAASNPAGTTTLDGVPIAFTG